MKLMRVLRISRPRFWIYELGPYMIGIIAALLYANQWGGLDWWLIILLGRYFLIPANIWIYGINDIYDYDTDKLNPKKQQYEALVLPSEQGSLWKWMLVTTIPVVIIVSIVAPIYITVGLVLAIGLYSYYSATPIRAKARSYRDCIFSASLYTLPGVIGYLMIGALGSLNRGYILAGWCWCVAMQLYSAVPDITADTDAGLSTTATVLGARHSITTCAIFYLLAAILSYPALGIVSIILGVVYLVMMIRTLVRLQDISQIYRYFPWINMVSGMIIFLVLLYTFIYG